MNKIINIFDDNMLFNYFLDEDLDAFVSKMSRRDINLNTNNVADLKRAVYDVASEFSESNDAIDTLGGEVDWIEGQIDELQEFVVQDAEIIADSLTYIEYLLHELRTRLTDEDINYLSLKYLIDKVQPK